MTIQNYIIEPQEFRLDGGAMFGIIPKPLWNKVHPADEDNRINLALRLWLIKDQVHGKNILIDTGIGDYHDEKFSKRFDIRSLSSSNPGHPNSLEKALSHMGLSKMDITDLVISHLHFDHAGGLLDEHHRPNFPNATLHLHQKHWEYSQAPTEKDQGSFHHHIINPGVESYKSLGKIHWLTEDSGEIFPGLNFVVTHGHTPYLLHPYSDKFIYLADLIPTSNHVHIPWVMGYDLSPGETVKEKRTVLEFAYEKNLAIIFEHDPLYYGARIGKKEASSTATRPEFFCLEKYSRTDVSAYSV